MTYLKVLITVCVLYCVTVECVAAWYLDDRDDASFELGLYYRYTPMSSFAVFADYDDTSYYNTKRRNFAEWGRKIDSVKRKRNHFDSLYKKTRRLLPEFLR